MTRAGEEPIRMGWIWRAICQAIGHKWSDCEPGFCWRCHYWVPS